MPRARGGAGLFDRVAHVRSLCHRVFDHCEVVAVGIAEGGEAHAAGGGLGFRGGKAAGGEVGLRLDRGVDHEVEQGGAGVPWDRAQPRPRERA